MHFSLSSDVHHSEEIGKNNPSNSTIRTPEPNFIQFIRIRKKETRKSFMEKSNEHQTTRKRKNKTPFRR
jgi:hypothetical protein